MAAVSKGLGEMGFVEGRNVAFEYRAADDHYDRFPALARELVSRQVAVIFTSTNVEAAQAAASLSAA
jgi:putative ABC transport system substrate-binding protein